MQRLLGALLALALVASPGAAQPNFQPEPGFRSLFNGKDLTGWVYKGSKEKLDGKTETPDKRIFVKDGVIVCGEGKGIKDLNTAEEFGDEFVLKVQFRAAPKADSGVYVRGPQLQVRDFIRRGEMKGKLTKFKNDDWNQLEITVKNHVTTFNGKALDAKDQLSIAVKDGVTTATLNGKPIPVNSLTIKHGAVAHCLCNGEFLEDMAVPARGPIGLQAETGVFEFRHVQIKTLGKASTARVINIDPVSAATLAQAITALQGETTAKKKLLLITESKGFVHGVVARPTTVTQGVTVDQFPKMDGLEVRIAKAKDPAKDKDRIVVAYTGRITKPIEIKNGDKVLAVVKPCTVEKTFMELAEKTGLYEVDCSQNSRVELTGENLKKYDGIFFYTTGSLPLNDSQKSDLLAFVRSGKGFGGSHCATDTFYNWPEYGQLIGGYFDGHPWHQKVRVIVEDSKHVSTRHLGASFEITDEIYQFKAPYSRDKLHVLMKLDMDSVKNPGKRADKDNALAWTREYGKGRVFYTALGHREEVWADPRFQQHVIGGLRYMFGMEK